MKRQYGWFLALVLVIGLVSCQPKPKDLTLESEAAAGYVKRAEAYLELSGEASEKEKWNLVIAYNDKAFADFDKAIELEPENGAIYNRRGDIYSGYGDNGSFNALPRALYSVSKEERFAKGIDDYTTVINLQPDNFDLYIKRGLAYKEIKMFDEAFADFEKAQTVDSKRTEGYSNIASMYNLSQMADIYDAEKAVEYYRKVLAINPDDQAAKRELEFMEKERVRKVREEALTLVEQLCNDKSNFSPAQWDQTWKGKEVTVAGYLRSYEEKTSIMTKDFKYVQRNVATFQLSKNDDILDLGMVQCVFSDAKTIARIADDIYNGRLKTATSMSFGGKKIEGEPATMFVVKGILQNADIGRAIGGDKVGGIPGGMFPTLFNCEIIE
jgi:tetratricopeptide (TPR) repeat protein